jgi:hypothetical protein
LVARLQWLLAMKEVSVKQLVTVALAATLIVGCKDDNKESSSSKPNSGAKDKGKAEKAALPPLTAEPAVEAITPADKPPFESVKFRMTDQRNGPGWPLYEAWNLGTKPIKFMAIYLYAYDKDGKQVARTDTPLSWNGDLKPGQKSDFDIDVGGFGDPIPGSSAAYDICFDSIKFEGDTDFTSDTSRCPEQKPKS